MYNKPKKSFWSFVTPIPLKSSLIHSYIVAFMSVINDNNFQYVGIFQPLLLVFHSLIGKGFSATEQNLSNILTEGRKQSQKEKIWCIQ